MRLITLILAVLLFLSACHKNKINNVAKVMVYDKIIINDGGNIMRDSQIADHTFPLLGCSYIVNGNNSSVSLSTVAKASSASYCPIFMQIGNARGGGGIGSYKEYKGNADCLYLVFNSNGPDYIIDTAVVNITSFAGETLVGTFQLWLGNGINNKVVTGSFTFYDAHVN